MGHAASTRGAPPVLAAVGRGCPVVVRQLTSSGRSRRTARRPTALERRVESISGSRAGEARAPTWGRDIDAHHTAPWLHLPATAVAHSAVRQLALCACELGRPVSRRGGLVGPAAGGHRSALAISWQGPQAIGCHCLLSIAGAEAARGEAPAHTDERGVGIGGPRRPQIVRCRRGEDLWLFDLTNSNNRSSKTGNNNTPRVATSAPAHGVWGRA